jgi:hypothetical protein
LRGYITRATCALPLFDIVGIAPCILGFGRW